MLKPYPHQQKSINQILKKFKDHRTLMFQLATGGGKTMVFCFLTKILHDNNKKTLILVDSETLVNQTKNTLSKIGVPCEVITSKVRKLKHNTNVYVSMVETANNRLAKNPDFFRQINLVINDEAHVLVFKKVLDYFPNSKILGVTATPVVLKRVSFSRCDLCNTEYEEVTTCCNAETMEWSRPFSLSMMYEDIIIGKGITELIEDGKLVKEQSVVKKSVNLEGLKQDKTGEYTNKSLNQTFSNELSLDALVNDYNQYLKGKKTMIFTSSTKVNKLLVDRFPNAKMYDSVNDTETRKNVLEWFKNTPDAILINTGVFTKGFDEPTIEGIMLYRATQSLSLFIQIVGRGGRSTNKIFKDKFWFLDYGENINRFNEWSDPDRDWKMLFWKGDGKEKPKKEQPESVKQCKECGMLFEKHLTECPNCGEIPKPAKKRVATPDGYILEPLNELPPPNGKKIVEYTISKGEGVHFAFRIMIGQILDLFRFYNVTKEQYNSALNSGELEKKIKIMIQKCYFTIIKSKLQGSNRTLKYLTDKTLDKINKLYTDDRNN